MPLRRIISGGQTGVDQGALDAAIELGIDHGGWCPKGRLSEIGPIPEQYQLQETTSAEYPVRTERNVVDSCGTLILYRGKLQGGSELTWRLAGKHNKPCKLVDLAESSEPQSVVLWLDEHDIEVLNVAGPRDSTAPGIAKEAMRFLTKVLRESC